MRHQITTAGLHGALPLLGAGMIAPVIFCLCVLVLLRLFIGSPPGKRQPPAPIARTFLTRREQAMLNVLEQVLPHCRIHAQVAMGALLDAPRMAMLAVVVTFALSDMSLVRLVRTLAILFFVTGSILCVDGVLGLRTEIDRTLRRRRVGRPARLLAVGKLIAGVFAFALSAIGIGL